MFMKFGTTWPQQSRLDTIRLLGSVGEPLNPAAFEWYGKHIGGSHTHIVDTWWQTETGMHMITTLPPNVPKPGFVGLPLPGITVAVVDLKGETVPPNQKGHLVVTTPWPSMLRAVHKDDAKYLNYWNKIPPYFYSGDYAIRDDDGFIQILGRTDDIIIVAGHNIGTAEIENALVAHISVAEAAVIGKPDDIRGNIIKAFVVLKSNFQPSIKLEQDIKNHLRSTLGPVATPHEMEFVNSVPKTRSGKIMRRLLRAKELNLPIGDATTLEN